MPVMEKVRETASEFRDEARETLENLKEEVAELKERLGHLVPLRRWRGRGPGRAGSGALASRAPWPWEEMMWSPWSLGMLGQPLWRLWDMWDGEAWPQVDVVQTDDAVRVRMELPGVDEGDVEVLLDGSSLTIRGEKRMECEDRGRDYWRHECAYGTFQRTIPLPCEIEPDEVTARFRKGVLTVTLPKARSARGNVRRITVQEG